MNAYGERMYVLNRKILIISIISILIVVSIVMLSTNHKLLIYDKNAKDKPTSHADYVFPIPIYTPSSTTNDTSKKNTSTKTSTTTTTNPTIPTTTTNPTIPTTTTNPTMPTTTTNPTMPTTTTNPTMPTTTNDIDKFDIKEIYPTLVEGREWYSKWDNSDARSWSDKSNDPDDPEFITAHKGTGSWSTAGDGILKISGSTPRMYVMDAKQKKNWHNVEITVYAERVSDDNIAYGGIMAYARTNHYIDTDLCDTRGYGGRFKYDGNIDFEKETAHHYEEGYAQVAIKNYWSRGMPNDEWIGYKFIVYDIKDNSQNTNVKVELWIDTTDGLNGGNWKKVDEFIDNGNNFGTGEVTCKEGIDPAMKLTSSDNRQGSETGKPNLAVYFRSDGVNDDGLLYKKASIREIAT